MARRNKLLPKRERTVSHLVLAPDELKARVNESELEELLRRARQEIDQRRLRGLSKREMYENAIHESGHAVAAVCLGIGPLLPGIKLWRHGKRAGGLDIRWGVTQVCLWSESDGVVRAEMEKSIVSLLAGREAQNRLTVVFSQKGWAALPVEFALAVELDGASRDDKMVRALLSQIPLRAEEWQASLYNSLLDRTRRLLDQNWPALLAVAQWILRTKHYSLSGKAITKLVNRKMHTKYRVVRSCRDL